MVVGAVGRWGWLWMDTGARWGWWWWSWHRLKTMGAVMPVCWAQWREWWTEQSLPSGEALVSWPVNTAVPSVARPWVTSELEPLWARQRADRKSCLAPTYPISEMRRARFNKSPVTSVWGCAGAGKLISGADTFFRAGVTPLPWQRANGVCTGFCLKTSHIAVLAGCQWAWVLRWRRQETHLPGWPCSPLTTRQHRTVHSRSTLLTGSWRYTYSPRAVGILLSWSPLTDQPTPSQRLQRQGVLPCLRTSSRPARTGPSMFKASAWILVQDKIDSTDKGEGTRPGQNLSPLQEPLLWASFPPKWAAGFVDHWDPEPFSYVYLYRKVLCSVQVTRSGSGAALTSLGLDFLLGSSVV